MFSNAFRFYFEANLHQPLGKVSIGIYRPNGEHAAGFERFKGCLNSM
jgi:hypothetical protein